MWNVAKSIRFAVHSSRELEDLLTERTGYPSMDTPSMAIFWAIMTMLLISQLHKFNSYSVSAIYALLEDEEKKAKEPRKKDQQRSFK